MQASIQVIFESTPQLLGIIDMEGRPILPTADTGRHTKVIGSYFLCFALQVVAECPYAEDNEKNTAMSLLRRTRTGSLEIGN
jgi:hypothetical protein